MSPGPRERRCSFAKCITDSTDVDLPNGTSHSPSRSLASRPMPVLVLSSQSRRILNSRYNLSAKASAASRTESHTLLTLDNLVRSILLAEDRRRAQELIGKGMNIRRAMWHTRSTRKDQASPKRIRKEMPLQPPAFFKEFANVVGILQKKPVSLVAICKRILQLIGDLFHCLYRLRSFRQYPGAFAEDRRRAQSPWPGLCQFRHLDRLS